jgi:hypothetical protein
MGLTTIKRILVNSKKANTVAKTERTKPKVKERGENKAFKCHKGGGSNHFAKNC